MAEKGLRGEEKHAVPQIDSFAAAAAAAAAVLIVFLNAAAAAAQLHPLESDSSQPPRRATLRHMDVNAHASRPHCKRAGMHLPVRGREDREEQHGERGGQGKACGRVKGET